MPWPPPFFSFLHASRARGKEAGGGIDPTFFPFSTHVACDCFAR